MKIITFKHSGNTGDIIYALPSIKAICKAQNAEADIYLRLNQESGFTDKQHPLGNKMLTEGMFEMLKPLLLSQDYISYVFFYENENIPEIQYDLDLFRKDFKNLSSGNIAQWIGNSYPDLRPNLYEPSIKIEAIINDWIIVNRTSRYQNLFYDYSILRHYENVYFVGVEDEYKAVRLHNANIKHLVVEDFLHLARIIAGCKLFIGNQSMAFAIAEQLKVPRILEQYYNAPNVIPQGGEYFVCHTNGQFKNALSLALNGKDSDIDTAQTPEPVQRTGKTIAMHGPGEKTTANEINPETPILE